MPQAPGDACPKVSVNTEYVHNKHFYRSLRRAANVIGLPDVASPVPDALDNHLKELINQRVSGLPLTGWCIKANHVLVELEQFVGAAMHKDLKQSRNTDSPEHHRLVRDISAALHRLGLAEVYSPSTGAGDAANPVGSLSVILYLVGDISFPYPATLPFDAEFKDFLESGRTVDEVKLAPHVVNEVDPCVYILWLLGKMRNERLHVVDFRHLLMMGRAKMLRLVPLLGLQYSMVVVGDITSMGLDEKDVADLDGFLLAVDSRLRLPASREFELYVRDKSQCLPTELFGEQLPRALVEYRPVSGFGDSLLMELDGDASGTIIFKPQFGSCGNGICRWHQGGWEDDVQPKEGGSYVVQLSNDDITKGEHRIWIQPTADGMQVVLHAKTFFEETGMISIVTELSDDPLDDDAKSPWEKFPASHELLQRVSVYISGKFELHGAPFRVDVFRSAERWYVNELEVFGVGELLSGKEWPESIAFCSGVAASIERNCNASLILRVVGSNQPTSLGVLHLPLPPQLIDDMNIVFHVRVFRLLDRGGLGQFLLL
ncbi:hypothetical protein CYMTET_14355 [Cymbomonas tetramitiformis]|uniref:Uncharacterized protein n=1 Tax=Cymbomonas tetramitiformis TaxID=36881 RepID=A0AAE0GGR4_9CHLO|nr:hypothetical protein CYMTET_14355 [Cymbomonas tetramitiformis]